MSRTFDSRPALRERVNLFIGLVGPSSSGKTLSALKLATGIQRVTGGDIYYIDSENRRATFYAGEYKFQHVQFDPPHGALDYVEAIKHCEQKGAKIIVLDSASHEHEGVNGLIEQHEAEMQRLAGDDYAKRERIKLLAWQKPKSARRVLLRKIITSQANILMCFRAKHISKPMKVNGKTEVVDQGFVPIAGEEFVFEMQLCAMLPPNCRGVPNWNPENPGEKMAVKLPMQFEQFIKPGEALNETLGQRLAEWASGGKNSGAVPVLNPQGTGETGTDRPAASVSTRDRLYARLYEVALTGGDALRDEWTKLTASERKLLGEQAKDDLKRLAAKEGAA